MRRHGSTVYVAVGTGDALHVGLTNDPASTFAKLSAGRLLPKALRDQQPVRLVFQLGLFPCRTSGGAGQRLLQGLPPARLRALLAGSRDELSFLADHLAELDLRYRLDSGSPGPVEPLDFERDLPLPSAPLESAPWRPAVALEHLRAHVEARRWRVLLARRQARRTLEDIGREEELSRERIRQMDAWAWSRGSRFLLRRLGEGWRDLTALCRTALETWGFVSGCSLLEVAQRLWGTEWSAEDREAWLLLFHLLGHRLASQEVWGVRVYSDETTKLLPRIAAFLDARVAATKVPAELQDLYRREWDCLQDACARETGRTRRPPPRLASEETYCALQEALSPPWKTARAAWIRSARQEGRPVPAPSLPLLQGPSCEAGTGETRPEERIGLDPALLQDFCQRWKIRKFWLFGSVLGNDFGPSSDVDVLVQFQPGASWSLFHLGDMEEELEGWFGRPVDLVDVEALSNPIRRAHILAHRKLVHEAP